MCIHIIKIKLTNITIKDFLSTPPHSLIYFGGPSNPSHSHMSFFVDKMLSVLEIPPEVNPGTLLRKLFFLKVLDPGGQKNPS